MNHIVSDFSKWKVLNEAEFPGRTKQTAGFGQKVVGIPVDEKSFKIKIVHDLRVIDEATGKITQNGWNSILTWIKNQPKWLPYYPGLGDLKNNFVIYHVDKDNANKQLITFTISPRSEAPGLPADRTIITQEEVKSLVTDSAKASILTQTVSTANASATGKASVSQAPVKITTPIALNNIAKVTSKDPAFSPIKKAYFALLKDPKLSSNPIFAKVKAELKAGTLGDASANFVKGIIAGFSIKDEYGDPVESIDQNVVDKMLTLGTPAKAAESPAVAKNESRLYEQETAPLPADFNTDLFLKAVGGTSAATGDIKLPEGGLKKANVPQGDETLKKIQQLIIDKFSKKLAGSDLYVAFAKYGADGVYGPTTEKMIAALKSGFGLADKTGTTITSELVNKLQTEKIDESYLNLNMRIFESFDSNAFTSTAKSYSATSTSAKSSTQSSAGTAQSTSTTGKFTRTKEDDQLAIDASEAIQNKFSDEAFWKPAKGVINDDEVKGERLYNNWFVKTIKAQYIDKMKPNDPNKALLLAADAVIRKKILKEFTADKLESIAKGALAAYAAAYVVPFPVVAAGLGVYGIYKLSTGSTADWTIDTVDGPLKYSVDCDF